MSSLETQATQENLSEALSTESLLFDEGESLNFEINNFKSENQFIFNTISEALLYAQIDESVGWKKTAQSLGGDILKKDGSGWHFRNENNELSSVTQSISNEKMKAEMSQVEDGLYKHGFSIFEHTRDNSVERTVYFADQKGNISYEVYEIKKEVLLAFSVSVLENSDFDSWDDESTYSLNSNNQFKIDIPRSVQKAPKIQSSETSWQRFWEELFKPRTPEAHDMHDSEQGLLSMFLPAPNKVTPSTVEKPGSKQNILELFANQFIAPLATPNWQEKREPETSTPTESDFSSKPSGKQELKEKNPSLSFNQQSAAKVKQGTNAFNPNIIEIKIAQASKDSEAKEQSPIVAPAQPKDLEQNTKKQQKAEAATTKDSNGFIEIKIVKGPEGTQTNEKKDAPEQKVKSNKNGNLNTSKKSETILITAEKNTAIKERVEIEDFKKTEPPKKLMRPAGTPKESLELIQFVPSPSSDPKPENSVNNKTLEEPYDSKPKPNQILLKQKFSMLAQPDTMDDGHGLTKGQKDLVRKKEQTGNLTSVENALVAIPIIDEPFKKFDAEPVTEYTAEKKESEVQKNNGDYKKTDFRVIQVKEVITQPSFIEARNQNKKANKPEQLVKEAKPATENINNPVKTVTPKAKKEVVAKEDLAQKITFSDKIETSVVQIQTLKEVPYELKPTMAPLEIEAPKVAADKTEQSIELTKKIQEGLPVKTVVGKNQQTKGVKAKPKKEPLSKEKILALAAVIKRVAGETKVRPVVKKAAMSPINSMAKETNSIQSVIENRARLRAIEFRRTNNFEEVQKIEILKKAKVKKVAVREAVSRKAFVQHQKPLTLATETQDDFNSAASLAMAA